MNFGNLQRLAEPQTPTNFVPLTGQEQTGSHAQVWHLIASTGGIQQAWYCWDDAENGGSFDLYGAVLTLRFPDGFSPVFGIAPRCSTRTKAANRLATMALLQGLAALLPTHATAVEGPAPWTQVPRRDAYSAFVSSVSVLPVFNPVVNDPLPYFQHALDWTTKRISVGYLSVDDGFGAVLNIGAPKRPSRALTWFVGPHLHDKEHAVKAVSRLAFVDERFRRLIPKPLLLTKSIALPPHRICAWDFDYSTACVVRAPLNLATAGRRTRAVFRWFRWATCWVAFMIVGNTSGLEYWWIPSTVLVQVGIGSVIAISLCMPGQPTEPVTLTLEIAYGYMRNLLHNHPLFVKLGIRANIAPATEAIPPWGAGHNGSEGIDHTPMPHIDWAKTCNITYLREDSAFNGILAGAGLEKDKMSALRGATILAGRHMATMRVIPLKGLPFDRWGCVLETTYGSDVIPRQTFFVPCTFPTRADAIEAACVHALYPSQMERVLARQLAEFEELPMNADKMAHMRDQEELIRMECDGLQLVVPTLAVENVDGQFQCTLTVNTMPPQSWVSELWATAELAEAHVIWEARRDGVIESINTTPTSYTAVFLDES